MSFQDSTQLPLQGEEVANSNSAMSQPRQQSGLAAHETTPPTCTVEHAPSGPSFLSLVPELRNEVYRYLLTLRDEMIDIRHPWKSADLHPSIIYTNRQIAQEAAAIFYGENSFTANIDYYEDFLRVDDAEPSTVKRAKNVQLRVTRSEAPEEARREEKAVQFSIPQDGHIYPPVFSRMRHLSLNVKFSCCTRRFETGPCDFYPDWVAQSLKTAVDALLPGSALRVLCVRVGVVDMGKEVPTWADLRIALEPLRALRGVREVSILDPGLDWDDLFVAKLIWDMMESD